MLLTTLSFLFAFVCLVLAIVPAIFIFHNVYEDGLFGRASLAAISVGAVVMLSAWLDKIGWAFPFDDVLPVLCFELTAAAAFLCWHLVRFHLRVVMKGECADCLHWLRDVVRRAVAR